MKLTGRTSSHFTRVAMMFADELGLTLELDVVHDVASLEPATYGGHPGLKIPTLHDGVGAHYGTENICRRLVELAGRAGDPRLVLFEHARSALVRNAQELAWHSMSAQVQLVFGLMFSKLPTDALMFVKARAGLKSSLVWLDAHLDAVLAELPALRDVSLLEVTLFCVVEHVRFRETVPLDDFAKLRVFVEAYGARRSAVRTAYRVT